MTIYERLQITVSQLFTQNTEPQNNFPKTKKGNETPEVVQQVMGDPQEQEQQQQEILDVEQNQAPPTRTRTTTQSSSPHCQAYPPHTYPPPPPYYHYDCRTFALRDQHHDMTSVPAALPTANIAFHYKPTKAPKETLQAIYKAGQYKAGLPLNLLMIHSFMAGVYIAMAGHLYLAVGGGVLGAALFPTGLIAVILTSAELFTGDALVFVVSTLGGKVGLDKLLRNWSVAWICNFAGAIFWASIIVYASDSLQDLGQVDTAIAIAKKKALQPWWDIFAKAIGANFMVCLAIWQATCAEDVTGKILALWFPIAGFVLMGLEHVIANQFLIPIGMMLLDDDDTTNSISVGRLWYALSAATLGNVVGGGLLVGAVYWYVYDATHLHYKKNNKNNNSPNPPQSQQPTIQQQQVSKHERILQDLEAGPVQQEQQRIPRNSQTLSSPDTSSVGEENK